MGRVLIISFLIWAIVFGFNPGIAGVWIVVALILMVAMAAIR